MNHPHRPYPQQPAWGQQPPQQPAWGAPPPPPPKKPVSAGLIAVLVTAALGVLIVAVNLSDDSSDKQPTAKTSSSPAAAAKPANPKKLDDAASLACDDFARGYKAAQTRQARIDLANKVNKWAQESDTDGIAVNAIVLARGSEGSAGAWQIGADAFAQTCLDAGWDG